MFFTYPLQTSKNAWTPCNLPLNIAFGSLGCVDNLAKFEKSISYLTNLIKATLNFIIIAGLKSPSLTIMWQANNIH